MSETELEEQEEQEHRYTVLVPHLELRFDREQKALILQDTVGRFTLEEAKEFVKKARETLRDFARNLETACERYLGIESLAICPNCGLGYREPDYFCSKCGTELEYAPEVDIADIG